MENQRIDRSFLRYSSLGLELGVTLVLFTLAGLFLDRKFQTLPGYTLFLAACGFGLGLYRLISTCKKISKRNGENSNGEGGGN